MDLRLPLLADANLHLGVAEEALAEKSYETARREWEKASLALLELKEHYPQDSKEEGLFLAMYQPLQLRSDAIRAALPSVGAVGEVPEEEVALLVDDEEDLLESDEEVL